jgi:hypothetical protein
MLSFTLYYVIIPILVCQYRDREIEMNKPSMRGVFHPHEMWIDLGSRLPENDQECLICDRKGNITAATYDVSGGFFGVDGTGMTLSNRDNYALIKLENVDAWMPLSYIKRVVDRD